METAFNRKGSGLRWNVTLYSGKVSWPVGGACCPLLQRWTVRRTRNQNNSAWCLLHILSDPEAVGNMLLRNIDDLPSPSVPNKFHFIHCQHNGFKTSIHINFQATWLTSWAGSFRTTRVRVNTVLDFKNILRKPSLLSGADPTEILL